MNKDRIRWLDEYIYRILKKNVRSMPKRIVKGIANYYPDARIRRRYWRELGVYMGKNTYTNLGFKCTSNGENLVYIGNNVSIGPNVVMIPDSCANNGIRINHIQEVKNRYTKKEKIIIHDEVWIGAGVIILPGVHIGTCSVIGAGSVVTKDVDSYSLYMGIPAKKIKSFLMEDNCE